MNNLHLLIVLCLIMLFNPGCSYKSVKAQHEFSAVQKTTKNILDQEVRLRSWPDNYINTETQENLERGISRDDAVSIALQNNAELQAHFHELGIAKSDLVQAGLYSNPNIVGSFDIPINNKGANKAIKSQIDLACTWSLSDLWQVPFKKKVSANQLEIITNEIIQATLQVYADTNVAYTTAFIAHDQLNNAQGILKEAQKLRDQIYYRQEFGLSSQDVMNLSDSRVNQWRAEVNQLTNTLNNSYVRLKQLFALNPTIEPIKLSESGSYNLPLVPEILILEQYALEHNPTLLVAQTKIVQAKNQLTLEKSRALDKVDVGIAFGQEFDGTRGVGPAISIKVPIFDTNYAQIARANFLIQKTEQEYVAQKKKILATLHASYDTLTRATQEIVSYQEMIPSYEHTIQYADTYEKTMQVNELLKIQAQIELYEAKKKLFYAHYRAMIALTDLEVAVGKKLVSKI